MAKSTHDPARTSGVCDDGHGLSTAHDVAPLAIAAPCLGVLVLLLWSSVTGHTALASVLSLTYGTVGIGGAFVQVFRSLRRALIPSLLLSGLSYWTLVGVFLVLAHTWELASYLYWISIAASGLVHLTVAVRTVAKVNTYVSVLARHVDATAALATAGLLLVVMSAVHTAPLVPGPYGLFDAVPAAWYVGLASGICAVSVAAARRSPNVGYAILCIAAALSTTPAVIYAIVRYGWAQKHIGVVALFKTTGVRLDPQDIYQAWSGLFAGIAWLMTAGGNVQEVARWWPVMVDLAVLLLVREIGRRIGLRPWQAWTAALLVEVGNTIGQDYFSPQALSFVESLALVALAIRPKGSQRNLTKLEWVVFVAGSISVGVSHQLTPYLLTLILLVLTLGGMTASRWLPLTVGMPSVIWAVVNRGIVGQFFQIDKIGAVSTNAVTPGLGGHYQVMGQLARASLAASVGIVVITGGIGWVLQRNRQNTVLLACGVCPVVILFVVHYGQEDLYRIALFGLPWWALLAAGSAIPRVVSAIPRVNSLSDKAVFFTVSLCVGAATILYSLATEGNDYTNVIRSSDLKVATYFEERATEGSTLYVLGYVGYSPTHMTARYGEFRYFNLQPPRAAPMEAAEAFTRSIRSDGPRTGTRTEVFVFVCVQGKAVGIADQLWTGSEYDNFVKALRRTDQWHVVYHVGGSSLLLLSSQRGSS